MNQKLKPVLLAALLGGLSILVAGALSGSQNPGGSGSNNGEHGDNPVVGSLPIEVAPELDLMFAGDGYCPSVVSDPVLGLVGGSDLENHVLDAGGVPYGRVNRGSGFSILGLVHDGYLVVTREDGRTGTVELKQWLPEPYIGGKITMVSNIGTFSVDIDVNLTQLPLKFLCNSTAPVVDAWITASGGRDSNTSDLSIHVVAVGEIVTVTYMP